MKKRLLSILLVLSLMLALVPAAFAADDVSAELESDGTTLTFSGRGAATRAQMAVILAQFCRELNVWNEPIPLV